MKCQFSSMNCSTFMVHDAHDVLEGKAYQSIDMIFILDSTLVDRNIVNMED